MATATFLLTGYEARTHELLDAFIESNPNFDGARMVASALKPLYYASLPAARINAIAVAMHGLVECNLQPVLTAMVKAKVLRSRVERGERLYEVNY